MPTTPSGMYWESRGPIQAPPVLLIEGFTGQLIGWRDGFCDLLIAAGLRVIRMDNRDIGLSRHEEGPAATYTIADMARDVVDVIAHAELPKATIVGQSMGGMIAQHVALDHPEVVAGVVLFYTTPTLEDVNPDLLHSAIAVPRDRDDAIALFLDSDVSTRSPAYEYDTTWKRELAGLMYDRDPSRAGLRNQQAAIARFTDLRPRLPEITVPLALIHGRDDTAIADIGSVRIAQYVPQAELHLLPGLGHEIAPALWPDFVQIIARTVSRSRQP